MPLLRRKNVQMCEPPPGLDGSKDQEVFYLRATGEIFLTYEAYSARMSFFLQKIFTCEYTGKGGLDYFQALDSEYEESKKTQLKFPDILKPRVLRACQFQVEGRLESLADHCYDRFSNRYFLREKVIVMNPEGEHGHADTFFGVVIRVDPPPAIRALLPPAVLNSGRRDSLPVNQEPGVYYHTREELELDVIAHTLGTRLELSKAETDYSDPPYEYTYVVRLMEGSRFAGSDVRVTAANLSRDRISWSKLLLKKFLKESMNRDSSIGAPWIVKERFATLYNIPTVLSEDMKVKGGQAKDDLLIKRRGGKPQKRPATDTLDKAPGKRAKGDSAVPPPAIILGLQAPTQAIAPRPGSGISMTASAPISLPMPKRGRQPAPAPTMTAAIPQPRQRAPKYPIEDLDLDPTTIFDGRTRNRKDAVLPDLPVRPLHRTDLPVPQEIFSTFITCWNYINIFGQPLQISPFTLDDFANALNHKTLEPRCVLLGEIHAVLTSNIASEAGRLTGSSQPNVDSIPHLAATTADVDGMTVSEREMWVTAGMEYCRGWDRKARPKAADERQGWEHHLLGVLTQRGGLDAMPGLPTILKHLFTDAEDKAQTTDRKRNKGKDPEDLSNGDNTDTPEVPGTEDEKKAADEETKPAADAPLPKNESVEEPSETTVPKEESVSASEDKPVDVEEEPTDEKANGDGDDSKSQAENGETSEENAEDEPETPRRAPKMPYAGSDDPDPESRYLTLKLSQKLEILTFLCNHSMMSKVIRNYVDDCETRLTEDRKEKADINKERRELLAEKALLEKTAAEGLTPNPQGDPISAAGTPQPLAIPSLDVDDSASISMAPSDRDDSVMADPPSRQVSSSPLPDLGADEDVSAVSRTSPVKGKSPLPAQSEVGSDVDELESSEDESKKAPAKPEPTKGKKGKKAKTPTPEPEPEPEPEPVDRKTQIEQELEMNTKKDDLYERDWRRHREVARIRPLGQDRFHQRYWWFDGIGCQSLIAPNGRIIYGTGRLFIQGPSAEDYQRMCDERGGEAELEERRVHEDRNQKESLLGVDEWGYYDTTDDELIRLLAWLNTKGVRENAFKANLMKWRHYIVQGAASRQSDLEEKDADPSAVSRKTRGGRKSQEGLGHAQHYLAYENSLAQK